jgi:serine/threonine protein kinase
MAPEIKEGKTYDGTQVDLFSIGVILFIIVKGIFPFKEARKEEYFYNLLMTGQLETYFEKVNGQSLSADFKDLILRLFSYDGSKRYTIEEIKSHPWMQYETFNKEMTRATLQAGLAAKQQEAAPFQQQPVKVKRSPKGVMA